MARKKVFGKCHICRKHTKLSFEHVPPRSAFNDYPAVYKGVFELINKDPDRYFERKGPISQRGIGAYKLCEKCNNDTGAWYGEAFASWARQGMETLMYTRGSPSLYYPFRIFPLRVIKQIVCMFLSITDIQFSYNHPDLVKFVLDKRERNLNPDIRIYAFFNIGGHGRYIGGASKMMMNPDEMNPNTLEEMTRTANTAAAESRLLSEIACYPLGYVMSFDPEPPDTRLIDISFFAGYTYFEWRFLPLQLAALPVWTYFPTDYRTREQVERDAERNQRDAERVRRVSD